MAVNSSLEFLSNLFNIPNSYFTYPNIIVFFILPFLSSLYLWFIILDKKIRIFRKKSSVNFFIALSISFFNSYLIAFLPPSIMVPLFISAAFFINKQRGSKKRFLISIGLFVFIRFLYNWIVAFLY